MGGEGRVGKMMRGVGRVIEIINMQMKQNTVDNIRIF
jgi:hypothetical protein